MWLMASGLMQSHGHSALLGIYRRDSRTICGTSAPSAASASAMSLRASAAGSPSTARQPSAPTLALYVLAGAWGVATGALEIAFGSRAWSLVPKALGFMLAGTVAFGFGLTLLVFPTESVQTLRAFFAVYAVVNGIAATALGEELHHTIAQPQPRAA